MKTRLCRAGWGAAALFAILSAAHAADPVVAFPVGAELSETSVLLPKGTPRQTFLECMGPPDARLSPDAWVYWNRCTNQPSRTMGYDAVVVVFASDRVSAMRIVASAPVRQFLAEQQARLSRTGRAAALASQPEDE